MFSGGCRRVDACALNDDDEPGLAVQCRGHAADWTGKHTTCVQQHCIRCSCNLMRRLEHCWRYVRCRNVPGPATCSVTNGSWSAIGVTKPGPGLLPRANGRHCPFHPWSAGLKGGNACGPHILDPTWISSGACRRATAPPGPSAEAQCSAYSAASPASGVIYLASNWVTAPGDRVVSSPTMRAGCASCGQTHTHIALF